MAKKAVGKGKTRKNNELDKKINIYINRFLDDAVPEFARYRSYDFVHTLFAECIVSISQSQESGKTYEPDWDYLALNLYMFLGSWGMLRNSFLLENNYKCLIEICKLVCGREFVYSDKGEIIRDKKECTWLLDIKLTKKSFEDDEKFQQNYVSGVCTLIESIDKIFKSDNICRKKKTKNGKVTIYEPDATDTLVTKILLVTLGCVPAYDEYNKASLRNLGYSNSLKKSDNYEALNDLMDFVKAHIGPFTTAIEDAEKKRAGMYDKNVPVYSTMKYVDMILWEYARMNGLKKEKNSSSKPKSGQT